MLTSEILSQVRRIEIRTGKLVTETFAGEYLSVFKGHGMEFAEVREYATGDDVRSIDWNVSARLGKPYVRRYVEERELTLMLACDISGSQHFGSGSRFKSEAATELSALFAFSALKNNDKVGLMLFSDKVELYIPPKKGRLHALRVIREIMAYEPKSRGTDIALCLDTINRVFKKKGILILISDFMADNYEHSLRLASKRHDMIPVVIEDPLESSLPEINALFEIENPETGRRHTWDLSAGAFHSAFGAAHKDKKGKLKKLFTSLGIDWINIKPDGSIAGPVVDFFRKRAKKFK